MEDPSSFYYFEKWILRNKHVGTVFRIYPNINARINLDDFAIPSFIKSFLEKNTHFLEGFLSIQGHFLNYILVKKINIV